MIPRNMRAIVSMAALIGAGAMLVAETPADRAKDYGPPTKPQPETWKQRERRLRALADRATKR